MKMNRIQELQDVYALAMQSGMFIASTQSGLMTKGSQHPEWMRNILQRKEYMDQLTVLMSRMKHQDRSLYVDSWINGLHFIAVPIQLLKNDTCFAWIGPFVREISDERHLHDVMHEADVRQIEHLSEERYHVNLKAAEQFGQLLTSSIQSQYHEHMLQASLDLIQRTVQQEEHEVCIEDILQTCLEMSAGFDFWGYGAGDEAGHYEIQYTVGEDVKGLIGTTFQEGEGYLGHAILTREAQLWSQLESQPRAQFFESKGVQIKHLCGCPIYNQQQEVSGILFAGSRQESGEFSYEYALAQAIATLFGHIRISHRSREQLSLHMNRQSSIIEAAKYLSSSSDVKRKLFVLVDTCLNMIQHAQSILIVLKLSDHKAHIVSRGLHEDDVEPIARELAKKYMPADRTRINNEHQVYQHHVSPERCRLERPLYVADNIHGVIMVESRMHSNIQESIDLLDTIGIIGSLAIEAKGEHRQAQQTHTVTMLSLAVKQTDPAHYEGITQAEAWMKSFSKRLTITEAQLQQIESAIRLHGYDTSILEEAKISQQVIQYIDEYKRWSTHSMQPSNETIGKQSYSYIAQLIILTVTAAQHDNVDTMDISTDDLDGFDPLLLEQFQQFLLQHRTFENELSLDETASSTEANKLDNLNQLSERISLSKREEEVLLWVLQGLSNKEIANKLFISEHTVKNHMTSILNKLNVTDRNQAIAKVYQLLR